LFREEKLKNNKIIPDFCMFSAKIRD